jgi:hypothetical protein
MSSVFIGSIARTDWKKERRREQSNMQRADQEEGKKGTDWGWIR